MILVFNKKSEKLIEQIREKTKENIVFIKNIENIKDFDGLEKKDKNKDYDGCLIIMHSLELLNRLIDKSDNYFKLIFVLGTNDEINRRVLENKKTFSLISPEFNRNKDTLRSRKSGLNHVLCKIASNKNKLIIFNLTELINEQGLKQSYLLGKILQNIRLCKKFKTKYKFCYFIKNSKDLDMIFNKKNLKALEQGSIKKSF